MIAGVETVGTTENITKSNGWVLPLMARFSYLVSALLLGGVLVGPGSATAQGVAMVTDLSGRATAQQPVTILSEISVDARVQLEPGGRMVVIYLKSGDEYTFSGPVQIQFRAAEPQVLSGAA